MRCGTISQFITLVAVLAFEGARAQSPLAEANRILSQPDLISKPSLPKSTPIKIEYDYDDYVPPPGKAGDAVSVGAVNVEGATDIEASAFSAAVEPFVGRQLKSDELTALCRAVAAVVRQRGYGFATAYIPPQALALGILTLKVDEGVIAEVRIKGTANRQLRRALAQLVGHAPTVREAERQIMLAADLPGITVQKVSFVREGACGVLIVTVSERRLSGVTSIDNFGSESLGRVRLNLSVDIARVFTDGDALTVAGVATPVKPKELSFVVLKYALPVDVDGTVLSATASLGKTHPGGVLADYNVRGKSFDLALAVSHPLARNRTASLWLGGGIEYLTSSQSILGFPLDEDHLTTAWLSLNGDAQLLGGKLRSELTLTQGLPWFKATRFGDPFSSRPDGDGVFTKVKFSADWAGPLYRSVSLRVAMAAQLASGPLLSAHEIGLGGQSFGRAFEYSERSGDNGVLGLVELRTSFDNPVKGIDWVQPFVFMDGGRVVVLNAGTGGGTLLSAGGGVRTRIGTTFFNLESAFPLNAERLETGNKKPRINAQLTKAF